MRARCASCSPTTTASRPRGCRRCGARCSTLDGIELAVDRARRQPLGDRRARSRRAGRCGSSESTSTTARVGFATDGTPVDCVRLASARPDRRLRARPRRLRHQPRRQPRRRHHLLGHRRRGAGGRSSSACPAIAVSQQSAAPARWTSGSASRFDFEHRRRSPRGSSTSSTTCRCPPARCSTSTSPAGEPDGVEVARLGKRIYRDELRLERGARTGGRRYWIYGAEPGFQDEPGHRPRRGRRAGTSR